MERGSKKGQAGWGRQRLEEASDARLKSWSSFVLA